MPISYIEKDSLLEDIYNLLKDKNKLRDLEFKYWIDYNNIVVDNNESLDPENFPDFTYQLDNLKVVFIGYLSNVIIICIENVSKKYLYDVLKFKYPDKNIKVIYKLYKISNYLLHIINNLVIYRIDDTNLKKRYDKISEWIRKNKVIFKVFNDGVKKEYIPLLSNYV